MKNTLLNIPSSYSQLLLIQEEPSEKSLEQLHYSSTSSAKNDLFFSFNYFGGTITKNCIAINELEIINNMTGQSIACYVIMSIVLVPN